MTICLVRMNNKKHKGQYFIHKGFSLIEIVIVLGLIAVMVTWITVSVSNVETEQQLRKASNGIVSMAIQARNVSVRQQRPYVVTIIKDNVSFAPKYPSLGDKEADDDERDEDENSTIRAIAHEDVMDSKNNDEAVIFEIQRWASDDWVLLEKDKKISFSIDSSGLVEPIGIRCTIGESWLIQRLHPLTAGVRDEEMTITKD